jgi:3-oxoacyl-(acyl-carrier-protein) synthase
MIAEAARTGCQARPGWRKPDAAVAVSAVAYAISPSIRDHWPEHASCSCAAGAIAIGEAMRYIQRGEAEVMLAGG